MNKYKKAIDIWLELIKLRKKLSDIPYNDVSDIPVADRQVKDIKNFLAQQSLPNPPVAPLGDIVKIAAKLTKVAYDDMMKLIDLYTQGYDISDINNKLLLQSRWQVMNWEIDFGDCKPEKKDILNARIVIDKNPIYTASTNKDSIAVWIGTQYEGVAIKLMWTADGDELILQLKGTKGVKKYDQYNANVQIDKKYKIKPYLTRREYKL